MNDNVRMLIGCCVAALVLCGAPLRLYAHEGHGDHDPRHGGVVLMYGADLHYELVLQPTGNVRIYFSDAQRMELPASVVADVAIEVERQGSRPETLAMAISATGEYWEGQGGPVKEAGTNLNLAFVFRGEPVVISFPASVLLAATGTSGAGRPGGGAHGGAVVQHGD
jgi:hypothetical protein